MAISSARCAASGSAGFLAKDALPIDQVAGLVHMIERLSDIRQPHREGETGRLRKTAKDDGKREVKTLWEGLIGLAPNAGVKLRGG